ncbi:transcription elongation factor, mitochondrial [Esox lucius]|uniref:transcription elongation factor, mitochondrial n=1 Tax=Esox lucius TaxID=8010 RepID=UPI001476855C|nr:transcription elongation factor, mitochondrial [Esox lucius]
MWVARRFLSLVARRGKYGLFCRSKGLQSELEFRYLNCTCCWRSRIPVAGFETLNGTLSSITPCDDHKSLDAYYTSEQRAVILQILNNATESELAAVKLLRGRKSVNIVDYRTRHGPFKDLESVINVPLLKHKSAVTVFNSILNPSQKTEKRKLRVQLAKFIRPEVERTWLEEASSIVSIVCGVNKIAWAHVDRGMNVLEWKHEDCPNFLKGTYMASAYLDDISTVVSHLPKTDFFVVEKPSISLQNTTLYPVMAHMRTVEAMLFALLEPRHTHPDVTAPPKVLNMIRTATGRHFDLMVGESRTSGAQTVRRMMTESVTQKISRVRFPHDLLVKYRNSFQMRGRDNGEELCDALLQAVAFYELLCDSK